MDSTPTNAVVAVGVTVASTAYQAHKGANAVKIPNKHRVVTGPSAATWREYGGARVSREM
jgi:hypothetical protein